MLLKGNGCRPVVKTGMILICFFILGACAAKTVPVAPYYDMSCDEIATEIETLNADVARSKNNEEIGRNVKTGASVGVQASSMGGVQYVAGIYSIFTTLMNHNKQTGQNKVKAMQENITLLEDIAYEKGCS